MIIERYNTGRGRNVEPFFTRVPSTSNAGTAFNRPRKERAAIRRWAQRNGHDITGSRTIPSAVRRAYERAQVGDSARPDTTAVQDDPARPDTTAVQDDPAHPADVEDGSPTVGVPDPRGVRRALTNGFGIRWVMDAYGLDYRTAKTIRDEHAAAEAPARPAHPAA